MLLKKQGFTLIELIVAMALITIVVGISADMMINAIRTQSLVSNSYDVNVEMRTASQYTNDVLRYSSAIFTVPEGRFFEGNLTEGWSYFGLSQDKREIIKYTYEQRLNGSNVLELRHWKDVVVATQPNIEYSLLFERVTSGTNDRLVKFSIVAHNTSNNTTSVAISSEVEVQNALQVVDRGTLLTPSIAIAYKAEERPQDQIVGVVTMVMDVSGSMGWNMNKSLTSNVPANDQRIGKVKSALNGYTKANNVVIPGMISEFAKEDNIEVAVVPFSTSANTPDVFSSSSTANHQFYKVAVASQSTALKSYIANLSANGGTNTGDGMRRAYYRNQYFKNNVKTMAGYGSKYTTKDYMIILVDGITTMASSVGGTGDSQYKVDDGYLANTTWYYDPAYWGNAGIIGHGSEKRDITDRYVELIGEKIKAAKTKVYVIGFSERSEELASVEEIATAAGALSTNVYKFTDNLDLDQVFSEIKADIMKDLWHVRGPKL